jgi:hypothetical protein
MKMHYSSTVPLPARDFHKEHVPNPRKPKVQNIGPTMKTAKTTLVAILIVGLLPAALPAAIYTYNTTDQIDDTRIFALSPDTAYGTSTLVTLRFGENPSNGLMSFDLSDISLPPGEAVASAVLTLYTVLHNNTETISFTFDVHQLLQPWDEATATWNQYSTGNSWTAPGMASGTDYVASSALAAGEIAPTVTANVFTTLNLDPALVQGWIDGSVSNHGLAIVPTAGVSNNASTYTQMNISSSENTTEARRPVLIVTTAAQSGWIGYPIEAGGWVDTGAWLGWVNVIESPWVWSVSINAYMYLPEEWITASGAYAYTARPNPPVASGEGTWAGYPVDAAGNADTGTWLGRVNVDMDPWIWSYSFNRYAYAAADWISSSGAWLWLTR